MNIILRVLLALDQSACFIVTEQNDFTISGWAYIRKVEDKKPWWNNFVNTLFFWQTEHCKHAFMWEWQEAAKLCERHDHLYEKTHMELYGQRPRNVRA
jgi:hypothetical protein